MYKNLEKILSFNEKVASGRSASHLFLCPRCTKFRTELDAVSRQGDFNVCTDCGIDEALEEMQRDGFDGGVI